MTLVKKEEYKGWTISVVSQETFCALFSFEITSPTGQSQQVKMGGENEAHAAHDRHSHCLTPPDDP